MRPDVVETFAALALGIVFGLLFAYAMTSVLAWLAHTVALPRHRRPRRRVRR